jgi:diguanylate cyclase (GGDEF)-like protein/PAS domain S-box-containing protein
MTSGYDWRKTLAKVFLYGWPFMAVVIVVLGFSLQSMNILSAARAYVGGEGLWSKGQKEAVEYLFRYAETRDPGYYDKFRESISVPQSDERVRLEMDRARPDYRVTLENFVRGRNHPDDHDGIVMLYRYFGNTPWMRDSISAWIKGDALIANLAAAGETLHKAIEAGVTDPETIAALLANIRRINDQLSPFEYEFSAALGNASRSVRAVLGTTIVILASVLLLMGLILSWRILRRVEVAEAAADAEHERAQITLSSIADGVITTDRDGRIDYMNLAAERLTGWLFRDARGLPLPQVFRIVDEESRAPMADPVETALRERRAVPPTMRAALLRRDGSEIAVDEQAAPLRDAGGNATGAVLVFQDVATERRYTAKLSYQATHDALTGLPNRSEFEGRLAHTLTTVGAECPLAVLFLDIDQFKVINDTCGHAAGDELLRKVGAVLLGRIRKTDTLARLGGDEFGALLTNCDWSHAETLAEQLREALANMTFMWEGTSFRITTSVGMVHVTGRDHSQAEILSAADSACYIAKDKGRNRVQTHLPGDAELEKRHNEMNWINRIHAAIEDDRLRLYCQEILSLEVNAPRDMHFEVLLRMVDEQGELIPPMAFIPAAERYGLMTRLDRWVIRHVFERLAQERKAGRGYNATYAINLSGASLNDERMLDFIRGEFATHGIPTEAICFEVTETVAIAALDRAAQFMRQLRAMGCRFALDDFGSGMSSFGYLRELPVDFLKIDGRFVKRLQHDHVDRAMVESIHHIGRVMGIATIAEWVEDDDVVQTLRAIGVDFAQGYAIGKPRPMGEPSIYGAQAAMPAKPLRDRRAG